MKIQNTLFALLFVVTCCVCSAESNAQVITNSISQGRGIVAPYGVQYGGGQGYRIGPPIAGIQYGGGQGVRYGTQRFGVQYGGGQILRYGTPNAGVRIGGGEGVRVGTRRWGVQIGAQGLQIGRINRWNGR